MAVVVHAAYVLLCVCLCWQGSLSAKADVQEALEQFAKSGKLPPKVLEASIFRKPYFVRRFLPALLTPTPVCPVDSRSQPPEATLLQLLCQSCVSALSLFADID